jgi:hypothetical protein
LFSPSLKKTLLERIKLSVGTMLPDDWNHEVRFHEVADRLTMIVESITWGREIVTEGEVVIVPATAWDAVKEAMNRCLGALNRWYEGEGIRTFPWRFKVRGREIRTRMVHHVCPHIGKEWADHVRYLIVPEGRNAREHRAFERIRYLIQAPLEPAFGCAESRLYEIQHIFRGLR